MKKVVEGSKGVAEAVKLCRPQVIAAYPITPQTHITENLAQFVADGELKAEYVHAESEHSAASIVLGASAAGVRAYTATSSQGLILMAEVLFNIAGMRLPIVLTCVNRALSAPINIWNDQQDSFAVRDAGFIQLYAETNQEAADTHIQAFKISEHEDVQIPVMVAMDGYILSHSYEPLEIPSQEEVDGFLPSRKALFKLDPKSPLSFGVMGPPTHYMETRYHLHQDLKKAKEVIKEVDKEFGEIFGRSYGIVEDYFLHDAEVVFVSLGSVVGTIKEVVDALRSEGKKIGCLKIRLYRPFPSDEVREMLDGKKKVLVVEKDISLGATGGLYSDLAASLYGLPKAPSIYGFIVGLGGRDITTQTILKIIEESEKPAEPDKFIDLNEEIVKLPPLAERGS
jgi:pyruvate ferredoxin oxidoreductase alpha subunit